MDVLGSLGLTGAAQGRQRESRTSASSTSAPFHPTAVASPTTALG
jgi:hypothetical protein